MSVAFGLPERSTTSLSGERLWGPLAFAMTSEGALYVRALVRVCLCSLRMYSLSGPFENLRAWWLPACWVQSELDCADRQASPPKRGNLPTSEHFASQLAGRSSGNPDRPNGQLDELENAD